MLLVFYSVGILACLVGMHLVRRLSESHRSIVFTCPVKGCGVSIRATGSSDAELDRLHGLAVDHGKHGPGA